MADSLQTANTPPAGTSWPAGSTPNLRGGGQGDLIVSELQGQLYEQTYRGHRFSASIVGQVTTVALATTYTGLCLSNAPGNGFNLVLDEVGIAFLVAFTAASAIGLMAGFNATTAVTHSTPATITNDYFNNSLGGVAAVSPVGLVDSSATLPTAPVLKKILFAGLTGAITTEADFGSGQFVIRGGLVIPPGGYVAIYTSTASGAASMAATLHWTEVPITG